MPKSKITVAMYKYAGLVQKKNKYGNKKVTLQGVKFDSKKEGQRWLFLQSELKAGRISDLQRQVRYELIPAIKGTNAKGKPCCIQRATNYDADFVYKAHGRTWVEDVKGSEFVITKEFRLKEKLMLWRHGVHLLRVYNATAPICGGYKGGEFMFDED